MKIDNPIPIVRALWGNSEKTLKEIPKSPLFKNEAVFVWGLQNKAYLENLGYRAILVKDNLAKVVDLRNLHPFSVKEILEEHLNSYTGDHRYSTTKLHFAHKLEALRLADSMFGEYLFLDWDVDIIKTVDSSFFDLVRNKGSFQTPLYAYHEDWLKEIEQVEDLDENTRDFLTVQDSLLSTYSWKLDKLRVCPNACFIYCNNINVGADLIKIFNEYNLQTCIEEFAIFLYANCSLEEYIKTYEPIVINGREQEVKSKGMDKAIKEINKFTDKLLKKEVYLYHNT